MRKVVISFLILFLSDFCFCEELRAGVLNDYTRTPAVNLCQKLPSYAQPAIYSLQTVDFTNNSSLLTALLKNNIDVAVMSMSGALKAMENPSSDIKILAVVQNINLSLLTTTKKLKSVKECSGKTIYCFIKDSRIQTKIVEAFGNDVNIDFSLSSTQIQAKLISGEIEYALVTQPFTSFLLNKDNIKLCFNQNKIFEEKIGLMVLACKNDFFESNKDDINSFLKDYSREVQQMNENTDNEDYCFTFDSYENDSEL